MKTPNHNLELKDSLPKALKQKNPILYTESEVKSMFDKLFLDKVRYGNITSWVEEDMDAWFEINKKKYHD